MSGPSGNASVDLASTNAQRVQAVFDAREQVIPQRMCIAFVSFMLQLDDYGAREPEIKKAISSRRHQGKSAAERYEHTFIFFEFDAFFGRLKVFLKFSFFL